MLTRSGLTHPEVFAVVFLGSFCLLECSFLIENVHFRVQKSPSPVPISTQLNPIHDLPPRFPKIHLNIILPSLPKSSEWCFPFMLSSQNLHCYYIGNY
jgi:hypothetical protein